MDKQNRFPAKSSAGIVTIWKSETRFLYLYKIVRKRRRAREMCEMNPGENTKMRDEGI